jgi:hypothetical protein
MHRMDRPMAVDTVGMVMVRRMAAHYMKCEHLNTNRAGLTEKGGSLTSVAAQISIMAIETTKLATTLIWHDLWWIHFQRHLFVYFLALSCSMVL